MAFFSRIFNSKSTYVLEHEALIEKINLFKSNYQTLKYQQANSQLIYYKAVYDFHLSEVIKYAPDSQYRYKDVPPLILYEIVDKGIICKAKLTTNKLIEKKELQLPGILDLDNPIHYIFAYRITGRFESVVREYGLDDYSLKKDGLVRIEEHIEKNLLDYKGIIYNALIFIRDYQNSPRKDKYLLVDGDYFEELIEKLSKFK